MSFEDLESLLKEHDKNMKEITYNQYNNIKKGVYFIKNPNDVLNYLERDDIIPLDKDINKLWQKNSEERIINSVKKIMRRHK